MSGTLYHPLDDILAQTPQDCGGCGQPVEVQLVDYLGIFQPSPLEAGQYGYHVSTYCDHCRVRRVNRVLLP